MTTLERQNLDTAKRIAMQQIGKEGGNPAALPYDLEEAYVTALSTIILKTPQRFDATTVATARKELGDRPNTALETYTLGEAAGDFVDEAAKQVEKLNPVPQLASSVQTLLKIAPWVIAAGFLIYVGLNAKTFSKK